eukprot:TRINITY_DN6029_c0_g3_i3.p1 TRINITY_DN6029_c0_g3~~TRINITY_DN6029_c0_g3_i3.p1  ORF type:complete len:312 (-),score=35.04 TRINITY_DN6029_c0_g3_i3:211-1146(-)
MIPKQECCGIDWECSRNGTVVGEEKVAPVGYPLRRAFDTEFITKNALSLNEHKSPNLFRDNFSEKFFLKGPFLKDMQIFLPTKSYPAAYTLSCPVFEEGVDFFSHFENANLAKAFRISELEYELHLSEDYNTTGHYHWFYFKTTSRLPSNTAVDFKIVNMIKPTGLYSMGFKPFAYSLKANVGWTAAGDCVSYTPNKGHCLNARQYYTLRWKYTYQHDNDTVFFAQFIPYTYSDLLSDLKEIKDESTVRLDMLCKTLGKNVCPMLTITEGVDTYLSYSSERRISAMSKNTKKHVYDRVEKLQAKVRLCVML